VVLRDAGIRLKGHGTFQPIDRKPAFALKFNEFVSGQEYRGLSKLVLNNSAHDGSFMREWLAAELYHDAGIPAARITHARVVFNGRDLGFYVLAEAMNKNFLKRAFENGGGNLYEGESKDIDQKLDQENGDDTTQSDLKALLSATRAPAGQRLEKLRGILDVDEFASFLAMEMLTASTDGYAFMRNNYRIFHHPQTDKLMFLPHGLDGTFGSASFSPPTNSLVVKALWELPEFQKQYRARLGELAAKVWNIELMTNRVNAVAAKLIAAAPVRAMADEIEREARRLRYQIEQQSHFVEAEMKRALKN
jgi:spore coat protein H